MLNILWPVFIIISIVYAIFSGNIESLNNSVFESAENAVNLKNMETGNEEKVQIDNIVNIIKGGNN